MSCTALLVLFLLTTVSVVSGEDVRHQRLEEVNLQIEEMQGEITALEGALEEAEAQAKIVQHTLRSLSEREFRIKKDLNKVKASKIEAENIIRDIQNRILQVTELSQKRIRALYMMKTDDAYLSAVQIQNRAHLDKSMVYLARIRASDERLVDDMRLLRVKRDTETGKLTQLQKQQSDLLAQLELQKREVESQARTKEKALKGVKEKKGALDQKLLALKAHALRLETVVRSLTGGDDPAEEQDKSAGQRITGFEGSGFEKGYELMKPHRGPLIQKFGKTRGDETSMKKGIEFGGGGQIVAVADGRVAYVGKMPQIGSVVILDHGQRDYSLYGRLRTVSPSLGDIISQGDIIGEAGFPDERGRTFYFEVRRAGKPVDPQTLFSGSFSGARR